MNWMTSLENKLDLIFQKLEALEKLYWPYLNMYRKTN